MSYLLWVQCIKLPTLLPPSSHPPPHAHPLMISIIFAFIVHILLINWSCYVSPWGNECKCISSVDLVLVITNTDHVPVYNYVAQLLYDIVPVSVCACCNAFNKSFVSVDCLSFDVLYS